MTQCRTNSWDKAIGEIGVKVHRACYAAIKDIGMKQDASKEAGNCRFEAEAPKQGQTALLSRV